jgi:hypothetical protein
MMATFVRIMCLAARIWAVENSKSRACIGVGAFNLVRRSALERTGGFEELKLTVVDDVALGQMLKQSGARSAVLNGRRHLGLYFYRTIGEAARGTEKSALIAFSFSYLRFVFVTIAILWCELSPIIALALACVSLGTGVGGWVLLVLGIAGVCLALFSVLTVNGWLKTPLLPAVFFPVGVALSFALVARAAFLATWRGGHMWRGVLYPTDILREGNRLRFR